MAYVDDGDINDSNVTIIYCSYDGLWPEGEPYPGIKIVTRDGKGNVIDEEIINSGNHLDDLDDAEATMSDIVGEQYQEGWYCYIIMSRFYQTFSTEVRKKARELYAETQPQRKLGTRVKNMQLISLDPERWINLN